MFPNWFTEKTHPHEAQAVKSVSSQEQDTGPNHFAPPLSGPSISFPTTDTVLSPHDAAVEDIVGKLQDLRGAALPEEDNCAQEADALEPLPKNVYDTFDGQPIGLLHTGQLGKAKSEIWDHLARVRDLQSDIARMHAQMEGLGDSERGASSKQVSNDDGGLNPEEQAKAAQFAEFARLTRRFSDRKDAVESIMLKLETLSQTINEFHSNRAPLFRGKPLFPADISEEDRQPSRVATDRAVPTSGGNVFEESPESMLQSLEDSDVS